MTAPRSLICITVAFAASISASYAGPCSDDIVKMQARIDAKVAAMAAAGPTGPQGRGHGPPTDAALDG